MLKLTRDLINHFEDGSYRNKQIASYCDLIYKFGSVEDSILLLPVFLRNPTEHERILLLGPIMRNGNLEVAEYLFRNCFDGTELKENMPSEILHCLGYLGYDPITYILIKYMRAQDHYESQHACLGLLHLECEDYLPEIHEEIDKCFGKGLFNEFIPSLASKTKDNDLKGKIYDLGIKTASTDCNAGIILGVALYNDADLFKKIIWDEGWEAHYGGTGTDYWAYISMRILGIKFKDLFEEVKDSINNGLCMKQVEYRIEMLISLLKNMIRTTQMPLRNIPESKEDFEGIYETFFEWTDENKDNSITGIANEFLNNHDLYIELCNLRETLELKVEQELIEKNFL